VRIWNGGLPSVYLLNGVTGKITHRIESSHPPLGILPPSQFENRVVNMPIDEHDQVFMATDGVIEQRNAQGQMFGEERLERILNDVIDISDLADALRVEIVSFCEGVGQGDDMTFVALRAESSVMPLFQESAEQLAELQDPDWSLHLQLETGALRRTNPVPVLNHLIQEFNGSGDGLMHFELVLGELYKNALDHGVLGLDSAIKHSQDGFDDYYRLRDTRLDELHSGHVAIDIVNYPSDSGGVIELHVSDTGKGFAHHKVTEQQASDVDAHGRGIPLARALCSNLEFFGSGNRVKARYQWKSSD
jgi:hypothetical protein